MVNHNYYVYILTNRDRRVLYIGVTNDLDRRIFEHAQEALGPKKSFSGKFNCVFLIYYEHFTDIRVAIDREKQLKRWSRKKKEWLINQKNPTWQFLNLGEEILGLYQDE